MEVELLGTHAKERWNSFVAGWSGFGLLQTYEWGEFKENQGWQAIRLAISEGHRLVAGAQVLIKPIPFRLASIAYIPRGPLVNWQDEATASFLLEALHHVARQHHACFLRIEPPLLHSTEAQGLLSRYGFQVTGQTNQPRCTLVVNLEADLDVLFAHLPKKTRQQIRSCQRRGVTVRLGRESDLSTFYRLMCETGKRGKFSIRTPDYYELEYKMFKGSDYATLFLADYQGQTIAADMSFAFGQHAATFHGASDNAYRNLPVNEFLIWESIKWAKARGCRSYDLWGIPDEVGELVSADRPIPKDKRGGLWGVYNFKREFNGNVVYYVGSYDYVYSWAAYTGLTAMMSWLDSMGALNGLLDRS